MSVAIRPDCVVWSDVTGGSMLLDCLCGKELADVVVDVDQHITPWSTAVSQLWPSPPGDAAPKTAAGLNGGGGGGSFSQPAANCYASTGFIKEQIGALLQPSDNRLATKLFGNSRALTKEKLRQKATGRWIVHPCSNFR